MNESEEKSQLKTLQELYDAGLITSQEFTARRRAILDRLTGSLDPMQGSNGCTPCDDLTFNEKHREPGSEVAYEEPQESTLTGPAQPGKSQPRPKVNITSAQHHIGDRVRHPVYGTGVIEAIDLDVEGRSVITVRHPRTVWKCKPGELFLIERPSCSQDDCDPPATL